jgi:hypothetical protein
MITKQRIAGKLLQYMNHQISLTELVDWSENAILTGNFEEGVEATIRTALGTLAAADAEGFGLLWEDCEFIMNELGYQIKVDAALVA